MTKRSGNGSRKGRKKNTVARARLLENAVSPLRMLDFEIFRGNENFERAGFLLPKRYIRCPFPHPSLYGTDGSKEAFIHDDGREFIFEAKYQNVSGSVDEKLPYVFECFLASPIPNWIIWLDGNWWTKNPRGLAAICWLKDLAQSDRVPEGRHFYVCATEDEWHRLAMRLFKEERKAAA